MSEEGPPLEALTHRLAETPSEFLAPMPVAGAVISDLIRDLGGELLSVQKTEAFTPHGEKETRHVTLCLIAAWLLHDRWFLERGRYAASVLPLLGGLSALSDLTDPQKFIADPDRREELARVCLAALGLRPAGETEAQAADRLATLNSVERVRLLRDTRKAQERVRKVQEAIRKKAEEEAASSYGRE